VVVAQVPWRPTTTPAPPGPSRSKPPSWRVEGFKTPSPAPTPPTHRWPALAGWLPIRTLGTAGLLYVLGRAKLGHCQVDEAATFTC
jgi:hypothetical protein